MSNCLITKLKGSVDNEEIPYFDSIVLKIKSTSSQEAFTANSFGLELKTNGSISIHANGEGKVSTDFSSLPSGGVSDLEIDNTEDNYIQVYFSNNDFDVVIGGASNIVGIKRPNYSSVSYVAVSIGTSMPALEELSVYNLVYAHHNELDFKYLKDSPLQVFLFKDSKLSSIKNSSNYTNLAKNIIGDFSILSQKDIEELDLTGVQPSNALIIGDTASLIQEHLTSFRFRYTTLPYSPVEDYIEAYKEAGLASSTNKGIYCPYLLSFTKFLGTKFNVTSLYQKLFWDDHKYGVAIGATESNNWNTASTIYVHGATQEEITAWENADKTVIVVNESE